MPRQDRLRAPERLRVALAVVPPKRCALAQRNAGEEEDRVGRVLVVRRGAEVLVLLARSVAVWACRWNNTKCLELRDYRIRDAFGLSVTLPKLFNLR